MKRAYAAICPCLLLATLTAWAMPPRPGISEPAALREARQQGRIDNPGQGLLQQQLAKGGPAKISGSRKYPVVLGYFTDQTATNPQGDFQTMLFSAAAGAKSVNNYFRDMSYTAMSCSGSVAAWTSCGHTLAYIGNGNNGLTAGTTKNVYEFINGVLAASDAAMNFADSAYDVNHDGYVDVLWVVHSGRGAEETGNANDIWSHSTLLTNFGGGATYYTTNDISPFTGSNVRINQYIIMPERTKWADGDSSTAEIIGCGVFCHEFGHALGLPDLYDTGTNQSIAGSGLGLFTLMAAGSWGGNYLTNATPTGLDVWSKRFLGWLAPSMVKIPGLYTIRSTLETPTGSSYKAAKFGADTTSQYWLIENRYRKARGPYSNVAWDTLLRAEGLGIYHIDSVYTSGTFLSENKVNRNSTNDVTRNRPYGVALEETDMTSAGYTSELWQGLSYGESVDLWSSSTQGIFNNTGTDFPISYLNDGLTPTDVLINTISAAGDTMSFTNFMDFAIGLLQNPAFPQYLVIAATSSKALLNPSALDTAQMRIAGSATEALGFARIAGSWSYEVDYELHIAGTHTVHLAAEDSNHVWRRADRQFEVVSGKAGGGPVYADAFRLELAPGALPHDMLLALVPAVSVAGPGMEAITQAVQVGPEGYPLARPSQLALAYAIQHLGGRDPGQLGIYRLENGQWQYLGGVLDQQGQQVLAEVDRLGTYLLAWSQSNPPLGRLATQLGSNVHPNPFTDRAEIRYQLAGTGPVRLAVYNATGQLVRQLVNGSQGAGLHRAVWDGTDGQGHPTASGIYLFRLQAGPQAQTGRMVKVR